MKKRFLVALSVGLAAFGVCVPLLAKDKGPGMDLIRDKPPQEAATAALVEAEALAGDDSWGLIAIARVYYLTGNKEKAQSLLDRVISKKPKASDWVRIGKLYAEGGDAAKADECFQKAVAADPKDDSGQADMGAWYIRMGQRAKGEEMLAKAFAKHADDNYHYVRAAEGLLGVREGL
jgi:tetratricopeptide (TPR) repeat protein